MKLTAPQLNALRFDVPCGDCGGPSSACGGNCGHVDPDAK